MQVIRDLQTGQFAGFIAEGNVPEFVSQFLAPPSKSKAIEPFTTVTEEEKRANFRQIKEDVKQILAERAKLNLVPVSSASRQQTNPNGRSDNWETFS